MTINHNSYPYYDDFDASKNYHRILFHPAKPVQARELTQIQSILQDQIKQHGDHIFSNGTMVIPGHVFYDDKVRFLKLETIYNQSNIESYLASMVGKKILGDTNKIEAILLHYEIKTGTEPTTVFIKYTSGSGTIKEFVSGETLTCPDIAGLTFKISPLTSYTGDASICSVGDGVYYINGYFVGIAKQTVTISKYSNTASAVVGLDYRETTVTENEDETLYDNAFGFTNYGAPGAHRLKVSLTLSVKDYDYATTNTSELKFIDLLKIKDGAIQYLKNETKYAEIEKWLARRTFEESGNYVVTPFSFSAVDYRNNDRGQWVQNIPYLIGDISTNAGNSYIALNTGYSGATVPVQTYGIQSDGSIYWNQITNKNQFINGGKVINTSTDLSSHLADDQLMFITTSTGKAYINGFEVQFTSPTYTTATKARTKKQVNNTQLYAPVGAYLTINMLRGVPNVTTNLTKVNLLDVGGATIGTAWVRSLEYSSGDLSTPNTVEYRLFLFGVLMNVGKNLFKDAHSISSTPFTANIKPTLTKISGSVSTSGASTTITGVGTYFDFDLIVGQRVLIGSTWTSVASITSPTVFIASSSVTASAGTTIYVGTSTQTKVGAYLTNLPATSIATMRASDGSIDTEFIINKYYTFTTTGTTYVITLTNGETFEPTKHTVVLNTGTVGNDTAVNATYTLNGNATQLTIGALTSSTSYKALLIVKRVGTYAKEKSKTLSVSTITLNNAGTQTYASKTISLNKADCVRIVKITQSGDASDKVNYVSSDEVDVTRFFTFDNGQREEFYDVGKIFTTTAFNRPLRITFEYFFHSDGDYFSVDSYSSVPRVMWPTQILAGVSFFLADYIDFRSRISDSGTEFNNSSGASVSDPIHSEFTIDTSYSYYLGRSDTLAITDQNSIIYNEGTTTKEGMKLCDIYVNPYTFNAKTDTKLVDSQILNYTMEDVGGLDTRMKSIEYYVALTSLEKNTIETSITDSLGLERTKNGFVVDDFINHEIGDTLNSDFKCTIDYENNLCLPRTTVEVPKLIEPEGTTDGARLGSGYQITGDCLTLPYTETTLISQNIASRTINIQAYVAIDFTGIMSINPPEDNWVDKVSVLHHNNTIGTDITDVQITYVDKIIFTPPPKPRRFGKIICTKLFELGFLGREIFVADQAFGRYLQRTSPDAFDGYTTWAWTVVNWMDGTGPDLMFWVRDKEERKQKTKELSIRWAKTIATPWAMEMAYRMGVTKDSNFTGKILMGIGLPLCKLIGVRNRLFGKPSNPNSKIRGSMLLLILAISRGVVFLLDKPKDSSTTPITNN